MKRSTAAVAAALTTGLATALLVPGPSVQAASNQTIWVSQSDGPLSESPSVSKDGRWVAFSSEAEDLVVGKDDLNGYADIYLFDRSTRKNVLVTRNRAGGPANGESEEPVISANGKFIVFSSEASNLVKGDTNDATDVFRFTVATKKIVRLSINSAERQANGDSFEPVVSGDGKVVVFTSDATNLVKGDTNGYDDIFVRTGGTTGTTRRVSLSAGGKQANADSWGPSVPSMGVFIAFASNASNLVAGDKNGVSDVFVHSTLGGKRQMRLVSRSKAGAVGNDYSDYPSITGACTTVTKCQFSVAFESAATNLVGGDTNQAADIFVRRSVTGAVIRASLDSSGQQSDLFEESLQASISGNGRWVAFESTAAFGTSNDATSQIFLRDLSGKKTKLLSQYLSSIGNQDSYNPFISGGGGWVVFESLSTNLNGGGPDNFTIDVFEKGTGY
ncbi:MAG TPA: hypothetical protein VFK52_05850 [Nocardioidaceae bacterium]|nr:hypothetical protein [Nocardioidaceae bacterium]